MTCCNPGFILSPCYSLISLYSGSLPILALCVRTTVAGRAGDTPTATMTSKVAKIANNYYLPLIDRIMCRVSKAENGCWNWTGALRGKPSRGGPRGKIKIKGREFSVYRIVWEIYNGAIPAGCCICHTCDNPTCVNPAHLFSGTVQDNMRDMLRKGRGVVQRPGVASEMGKLGNLARYAAIRGKGGKGGK